MAALVREIGRQAQMIGYVKRLSTSSRPTAFVCIPLLLFVRKPTAATAG